MKTKKMPTWEQVTCGKKLTMKFAFVIIFTLITNGLHAAKFIPAELRFTDGKSLKGLATFPDKPDDKSVAFKSNDKSEAVTYQSESLKTLVYHFEDGIVEFDRIMIFPSLTNGKKMAGP